jgi:hypothetical protein
MIGQNKFAWQAWASDNPVLGTDIVADPARGHWRRACAKSGTRQKSRRPAFSSGASPDTRSFGLRGGCRSAREAGDNAPADP